MPKFIVEYEGEEEYDHRDRDAPMRLFMVSFLTEDHFKTADRTIKNRCPYLPLQYVRYKRRDKTMTRFGIGFLASDVAAQGAIDCLNSAGMDHLGNPYHIVVYCDDGAFIGIGRTDILTALEDEYPRGLGRSHNVALRSDLDYFEITGSYRVMR